MKILVLGSGAGGGFPQWNCNCENCDGYRQGTIKAKARTQSSIAVTDNNTDWILFNASPDIRQQILNSPLQPARSHRDSGIHTIILADSQIDHTTGLILLRECNKLTIYGTKPTYSDLTTHYPLLKVLEHYCEVDFREIDPEAGYFQLPAFPSIEIKPIMLQSESPPYSPNRGKSVPGANLGFMIGDLFTKQKVFYAPGLGKIDQTVHDCFSEANILLIDGTFWTEDEMLMRQVGNKKASEMGHITLSGPNGSLNVLNEIQDKRKILIHINNTNPILNEASEEYKTLIKHQIEVAYDGMLIQV